MTAKARSENASKTYPELHRLAWTPNWVFRRYSSEKQKEFVASTGVLAEDRLAAKAYKIGREKFDQWLGSYVDKSRPVLIRDLTRAVISAKETAKGGMAGRTYRSALNQAENHLMPAFGHLRPDQMTPLRWEQFIAEERRRGRNRQFFNLLKLLKEVMNRAHDEGLIDRVPKFKLTDADPEPPKYIPAGAYRMIRRAIPWPIKFLIFVMYYQGARPKEILRYRWDMISWDRGGVDILSIPGEITKTNRARAIPLNSRVSRSLRWAQRIFREGTGGDRVPQWLVRASESPWLFPSRVRPDQPISEYNAVWARAMKSLGETLKLGQPLGFTIYNLRDTFVTNRLKEGLSATFIGRYIDTSEAMIRRRYAVAEEEIMRRVAG